MTWPFKRVGEFLVESDVQSAAPSAERRIRVRLNAEGIEKRPLLSETEGATRYFRRSAGQFIYGKQNLHKGAFGVIPNELDGFESSSDLPAFDVADGLRSKWLEYFLRQGDFYKSLVNIARGAATKRIPPEAFFQVELPVPSPAVQDRLIAKMNLCVEEHAKLEHELTHQETLLAKLKQSILQEAIQGKLTADWRAAHPDVEPASQLLHRIQVEKNHLIAAKKLRPEKPLSKITPAEIPFEIPKSWEWCRLGSISKVWNGFAFSSHEFTTEGVPVIRIGDLVNGNVVATKSPRVALTKSTKLATHFWIPKGALLIAMSGATIGKTAINNSEDKLLLNQRVGRIEAIGNDVAFLKLFLDSIIQKNLEISYGAAQPNLSTEQINETVFPLPPRAEQTAIVERVEAVMTTCRALEAEIERSRTHAAHLLQAVLKEAFAPAAAVAA
jgi:type I restriction enzyme S subunit